MKLQMFDVLIVYIEMTVVDKLNGTRSYLNKIFDPALTGFFIFVQKLD